LHACAAKLIRIAGPIEISLPISKMKVIFIIDFDFGSLCYSG
jgi:hypothetical protein